MRVEAKVRNGRGNWQLGTAATDRALDLRFWWTHADLTQAEALRPCFEHPHDESRYCRYTPRARSESLAARALLRAMLRQELGARWSLASIAHAKGGAPFLPDLPDCSISLSHSGGQVAVTASLRATVGIDIEWMDPGLCMAPVIRRCFHPREARALEKLSGSAHSNLFYAWWVAKEAVCKCLHLGLALPAASFIIPNPLGSGPALGLRAEVWVTALPAPKGYRAALAWRGETSIP